MNQQQTTQGEPMYVESLMTEKEWNERLKTYPSSTKRYSEVNLRKTNSFKWRYKMGDPMSQEEIDIINTRLDIIKNNSYGNTKGS